MSADSVTLEGRRLAEANMTSTCTITRASGTTSINPTTGVETPDPPSTIYSGKCRLRLPAGNSNARQVDGVGQSLVEQSPVLSLPVSALSGNVRPDDVAVVVSPLDPLSVTVRIAGIHSQTHSTARRFPVEVTS